MEITKELFWRNISLFVFPNCCVRFTVEITEIYSPHVEFAKFLYHDFLKNFRENNFFSEEFTI